MNKHIKEITLISGCITSLLFSYGCSEELFVDEQNRNEKELIVKERTSTRIEKLSSLPEFNSFLNENIIQNKFSKSAKKTSLDGEKNVFVVEKNGTTSYSIIFYNEYGFDILVYNKGEKESSMIVKFIPDSKTKNNSFEDFTGLVKYFTLKGTLLGENRFENAKPITTPTNPQKSNKGSSNCSSTTITIAFPCNSGKHYPGESCDLSGSERAYYEYYTYTNCYVDEFPYPDGGGGGFGNPGDGPGPGGGGGGFSEFAFAIFLNTNTDLSQKYMTLSDDKKQYIEYVYNSQGEYLTQFAINLLSSNSSIELYQFVKWVDWYKEYKLSNTNVESYFMQNPQDLQILFALGADFFTQNPNISWDYLENWFFNGNNLNSSVMNEYLQDLKNPDIVKPTKRFKNNTKINGIYNQAKTASNFKQYLKNFEPTFSVAHLLFDIGETTQGNYAVTSVPKDYWIKITFNQSVDWNNTPKIIIADTFMHEMIHAEIFRKLLSIGSTNGNIDVNKITQYLNTHNYPGLFDYYVERTVGGENWQHEAMGAHYVNIMVNFLKQLYNNKYTDVEYKTVVWMGLKGTIAWNSLSQTERTLYETTWNEKYWTWEL
ncbi:MULTISPECIES: hypothetical protein [unclassified Empedobacter]|uniref:hypothetical protein n=1 Tax=unclassified Empedobacter TaxID=2643773 RepID=UPI0025B9ADD8|nr:MULTISPECIES: hypothetical protein [unclassified Empedobacter]